jgi:PPOX class probable F420-dependent enzyme
MELTESVRKFLDEARFAVVATINRDGTPQQTVVWYELRGDEIIMNTAKGRIKDLNLRRDPRLSFCVEDGYNYITIKGSATLDEANAQKDIEALATRYCGLERSKEMMRTQFSKEQRVTIRLKVERVSGVVQ